MPEYCTHGIHWWRWCHHCYPTRYRFYQARAIEQTRRQAAGNVPAATHQGQRYLLVAGPYDEGITPRE